MMKTDPLSALGRRTEPPPISWLMATSLAQPDLISLAAGFTDNETLPVDETRALLGGLLRSRAAGRAALQYGTTAGDSKLRSLTAGRVQALDGSRGRETYSPARTLLTSGSQQMLYMLSEALCDAGDIVLVEDPTYFVFLGILQSHGVEARGVRLRRDGIDIAHLRQVLQRLKQAGSLPRLKLLYIVSYHQNPTSTTTCFEKKAAALELLRHYERAAGHPIYLVEDAAYRELRFSGGDVASALAAGRNANRVIYVGTYSKPFATGVRVGFGFLPEPVLGAVIRVKGNHDFGSSSLLQHLLARALETGAYDRHLAALRRRYAHKAHVMLEAMKMHLPPEVAYTVPAGGLYFWARLPRGVSSGYRSRLFRSALDRKVLYVPGELCYARDPARPRPGHEMRLSFGAETERHLREGINRLGAALRALRRGRIAERD